MPMSVGQFTRQLFDVDDQKQMLQTMFNLVSRDLTHPLIMETALALTAGLPARDDDAEIQAIYDAVKYGNPDVPALQNGLRYIADPRTVDSYRAPHVTLEMLLRGANGGDCDDAAMLVACLLGAIGFRWGLRAWGPKKGDGFTHVYAVVATPKRDSDEWGSTYKQEDVALDTTVEQAHPGWEPPAGKTLTAWSD